MKYLLDTHILIWWHTGSVKLSKNYLGLLTTQEKNQEPVGLSVISLWEIAKLVEVGRLKAQLSLDTWFEELENDPLIELIPLDGSIVLESSRLGSKFHKDPVDQIIVATARTYGLKLLTADELIRKSGLVTLAV